MLSDTLFDQPSSTTTGSRTATTPRESRWGVQVVDVDGDGLDDEIVARREPDGTTPARRAGRVPAGLPFDDGSGGLVRTGAAALPVPT